MTKLLCVTILLLSQTPATAQTTFSSPGMQVGLLELYTSEGCSSCPPADRWVSSLISDERLWTEIIPLSFHVDYWDYIGWRDRFASPEFSKRQRRYAAEKAISTVYTPGFLYNGKEWRGWFNGRRTRYPEPGEPGILRLTITGPAATVHFAPRRGQAGDLEVSIGLLGFGLSTPVQAGENNGRVLRHDFVVLGLERERLIELDGQFSARLAVPESDVQATRFGIVAWIHRTDSQAPLQATGGWLTLD